MVVSFAGNPELTQAAANLTRVFFPTDTKEQVRIELYDRSEGTTLAVACVINGEIINCAESSDQAEVGKELKRIARVALVKGLRELKPDVHLPWGILTGIRPTKLIHRLLDKGCSDREIGELLAERYLIQADKISLGLEIAAKQRKYLPTPGESSQFVSVYVGIPFCPSRCSYCSFASYVGQGERLDQYLLSLKQEISALGEELGQRGIRVKTIYVGGGTPTILSQGQLQELLAVCFGSLRSKDTQEITVEAGRPDTLDQAKLETLLKFGVNRLSINPQTMSDSTLQRIGRNHTARQFVESFKLARQTGFTNINMDIILGLPGETLQDVKFTLQEVARLDPDSLTVHALAIKRKSYLRQEIEYSGPSVGLDGLYMQEEAERTARNLGMGPYYLYRQKQILNNLENVGYAKPSKESLYNIEIMEERRSIIGTGSGSSTKIVNPADWSLVNLQNPKDIERYRQTWRHSLENRMSRLDFILRG